MATAPRASAVSQAALQGDKSKAGSIVRVPAAELEALVTEAVGKLSADRPTSQTDIRDRIDRVAIGGTAIQIRLSEVGEGDDSVKTLTLPWKAPSPYRRREIIQGASDATTGARPMRANARAILIEALGNAHRWLDELLSDPRQTLVHRFRISNHFRQLGRAYRTKCGRQGLD